MRLASIATASSLADGGNIAIRSTGSAFQLVNSQITTSVQGGNGAGGNIALGSSAHALGSMILSGSVVDANAFGGPGGNINIFADVFLRSESSITASSRLTTPGTINVEARITDVSGSLAQLPGDLLATQNLLRTACARRVSDGKASSLVAAGREGIPPQPDGLLWSPLTAILPDLPAAYDERDVPRLTASAGVWTASNCAQ